MSSKIIKSDKPKAKYAHSTLNLSYKGNASETQAKPTLRQAGLQLVGKLQGTRRNPPPPPWVPSLKAEMGGQDTRINLVPPGGSGWGTGAATNSGENSTSLEPQVSSSSLLKDITKSQQKNSVENITNTISDVLQPSSIVKPPQKPFFAPRSSKTVISKNSGDSVLEVNTPPIVKQTGPTVPFYQRQSVNLSADAVLQDSQYEDSVESPEPTGNVLPNNITNATHTGWAALSNEQPDFQEHINFSDDENDQASLTSANHDEDRQKRPPQPQRILSTKDAPETQSDVSWAPHQEPQQTQPVTAFMQTTWESTKAGFPQSVLNMRPFSTNFHGPSDHPFQDSMPVLLTNSGVPGRNLIPDSNVHDPLLAARALNVLSLGSTDAQIQAQREAREFEYNTAISRAHMQRSKLSSEFVNNDCLTMENSPICPAKTSSDSAMFHHLSSQISNTTSASQQQQPSDMANMLAVMARAYETGGFPNIVPGMPGGSSSRPVSVKPPQNPMISPTWGTPAFHGSNPTQFMSNHLYEKIMEVCHSQQFISKDSAMQARIPNPSSDAFPDRPPDNYFPLSSAKSPISSTVNELQSSQSHVKVDYSVPHTANSRQHEIRDPIMKQTPENHIAYEIHQNSVDLRSQHSGQQCVRSMNDSPAILDSPAPPQTQHITPLMEVDVSSKWASKNIEAFQSPEDYQHGSTAKSKNSRAVGQCRNPVSRVLTSNDGTERSSYRDQHGSSKHKVKNKDLNLPPKDLRKSRGSRSAKMHSVPCAESREDRADIVAAAPAHFSDDNYDLDIACPSLETSNKQSSKSFGRGKRCADTGSRQMAVTFVAGQVSSGGTFPRRNQRGHRGASSARFTRSGYAADFDDHYNSGSGGNYSSTTYQESSACHESAAHYDSETVVRPRQVFYSGYKRGGSHPSYKYGKKGETADNNTGYVKSKSTGNFSRSGYSSRRYLEDTGMEDGRDQSGNDSTPVGKPLSIATRINGVNGRVREEVRCASIQPERKPNSCQKAKFTKTNDGHIFLSTLGLRSDDAENSDAPTSNTDLSEGAGICSPITSKSDHKISEAIVETQEQHRKQPFGGNYPASRRGTRNGGLRSNRSTTGGGGRYRNTPTTTQFRSSEEGTHPRRDRDRTNRYPDDDHDGGGSSVGTAARNGSAATMGSGNAASGCGGGGGGGGGGSGGNGLGNSGGYSHSTKQKDHPNAEPNFVEQPERQTDGSLSIRSAQHVCLASSTQANATNNSSSTNKRTNYNHSITGASPKPTSHRTNNASYSVASDGNDCEIWETASEGTCGFSSSALGDSQTSTSCSFQECSPNLESSPLTLPLSSQPEIVALSTDNDASDILVPDPSRQSLSKGDKWNENTSKSATATSTKVFDSRICSCSTSGSSHVLGKNCDVTVRHEGVGGGGGGGGGDSSDCNGGHQGSNYARRGWSVGYHSSRVNNQINAGSPPSFCSAPDETTLRSDINKSLIKNGDDKTVFDTKKEADAVSVSSISDSASDGFMEVRPKSHRKQRRPQQPQLKKQIATAMLIGEKKASMANSNERRGSSKPVGRDKTKSRGQSLNLSKSNITNVKRLQVEVSQKPKQQTEIISNRLKPSATAIVTSGTNDSKKFVSAAVGNAWLTPPIIPITSSEKVLVSQTVAETAAYNSRSFNVESKFSSSVGSATTKTSYAWSKVVGSKVTSSEKSSLTSTKPNDCTKSISPDSSKSPVSFESPLSKQGASSPKPSKSSISESSRRPPSSTIATPATKHKLPSAVESLGDTGDFASVTLWSPTSFNNTPPNSCIGGKTTVSPSFSTASATVATAVANVCKVRPQKQPAQSSSVPMPTSSLATNVPTPAITQSATSSETFMLQSSVTSCSRGNQPPPVTASGGCLGFYTNGNQSPTSPVTDQFPLGTIKQHKSSRIASSAYGYNSEIGLTSDGGNSVTPWTGKSFTPAAFHSSSNSLCNANYSEPSLLSVAKMTSDLPSDSMLSAAAMFLQSNSPHQQQNISNQPYRHSLAPIPVGQQPQASSMVGLGINELPRLQGFRSNSQNEENGYLANFGASGTIGSKATQQRGLYSLMQPAPHTQTLQHHATTPRNYPQWQLPVLDPHHHSTPPSNPMLLPTSQTVQGALLPPSQFGPGFPPPQPAPQHGFSPIVTNSYLGVIGGDRPSSTRLQSGQQQLQHASIYSAAAAAVAAAAVGTTHQTLCGPMTNTGFYPPPTSHLYGRNLAAAGSSPTHPTPPPAGTHSGMHAYDHSFALSGAGMPGCGPSGLYPSQGTVTGHHRGQPMHGGNPGSPASTPRATDIFHAAAAAAHQNHFAATSLHPAIAHNVVPSGAGNTGGGGGLGFY